MRITCRRPDHRTAERLENRRAPLLGLFLLTILLLSLPGMARATCCTTFGISTTCCNAFGCNCDGPCTNFGCQGLPTHLGEICGAVPMYPIWTPDGVQCKYCNPYTYPCPPGCCSPVAGTAPVAATLVKEVGPLYSLPVDSPVSAMERFKAIDTNGDGKISFEEAKNWIRKNAKDASISDKDLRSAFDALDRNKNGTIEPEELDASLAKH